MTSTAATSAPFPASHPHHVHQRRGSAGVASPSSLPVASTTGASPAGSAQPLASGLQSVLLDAQAGQPADGAAPTTGVASQIADRLQSLLGGGATGPADLKSVLDRLQQTLQQTLQSYRTAAPAPVNANIVA